MTNPKLNCEKSDSDSDSPNINTWPNILTCYSCKAYNRDNDSFPNSAKRLSSYFFSVPTPKGADLFCQSINHKRNRKKDRRVGAVTTKSRREREG